MIDAIVSPLGSSGSYYADDRFEPVDPPCVFIDHWGQERIQMAFNLDTGSAITCAQTTSPAWRGMLYAAFSDASCTMPVAASTAANVGGLPVATVAGAPYYVGGPPDAVTPANYYAWNATNSTCNAVNNTGGLSLWRWRQVPSRILNLLSNEPYTLAIEY